MNIYGIQKSTHFFIHSKNDMARGGSECPTRCLVTHTYSLTHSIHTLQPATALVIRVSKPYIPKYNKWCEYLHHHSANNSKQHSIKPLVHSEAVKCI